MVVTWEKTLQEINQSVIGKKNLRHQKNRFMMLSLKSKIKTNAGIDVVALSYAL